jgi:hypothetical protein
MDIGQKGSPVDRLKDGKPARGRPEFIKGWNDALKNER